jgi:histone H2A
MVVGGNQAGKGAKGLLMGKSTDVDNKKDKKKPISRSSRARLQACFLLFL